MKKIKPKYTVGETVNYVFTEIYRGFVFHLKICEVIPAKRKWQYRVSHNGKIMDESIPEDWLEKHG